MKKKHTKGKVNKSSRPVNTGRSIDFSRYVSNPLVHSLVIILLGYLIYSNSFVCSFHFDDRQNIVQNEDIQTLSIQTIWDLNHNRFLPYLSFALNFANSEYDVWGYHLVNLVIHLLNALLVYWMVLLLFATPALSDNTLARQKRSIAFFTALFFVSHPLATQSVTYIVQRMASMVTLFYFLTLALYVKARLVQRPVVKGLVFFGALLSLIAAMHTKENAYSLPVALLLFEIALFQDVKALRIWRDVRVWMLIVLLVGFGIFAFVRYGELIVRTMPAAFTNEYRAISSVDYLLTQFTVIPKYVQLLFLPVNLNLDYDYPLYNSLLQWQVMAGLVFILALLVTAFWIFHRYRHVSLGILFFLIGLSVESSIIPIDDLIFEHRTYLPSFGFFLILSTLLYSIAGRRNEWTFYGICGLIITVYAFSAYERNKVWKDDVSLFSDVISKSPNKARPYNSRGDYYFMTKQYQLAIRDFSAAVQANPAWSEAYSNRANSYLQLKNYDEAIADCLRAQALKNNSKLTREIATTAYHQRALMFHDEQQLDRAIDYYSKAIENNRDFMTSYVNRGNAYKSLNKYDLALADYGTAISLDSSFEKGYYNRAVLYIQKNEIQKAIADFTKAIQLQPNYNLAFYSRGQAYLKLNKMKEACSDFKQSYELGFTPAKQNFDILCGGQ